MKVWRVKTVILLLISLTLSACGPSSNKASDRSRLAAPEVTVTTVKSQAVSVSERYTCQIQSFHHIQIRAAETAHIESISVKSGQLVKQGDILGKMRATRATGNPGSKAEGHVLYFTAPFEGHIGRLTHHQGSLIKEGETLTTLSDDRQIWAYFSVPESRYLEFKAAHLEQHKDELKIELVLANGKTFDHPGKLGAIAATFNSDTGSVRFRADFANPEHILRHGQTGTVVIKQPDKHAIVVPQRATFELLENRYVYIVGKDGVARQRKIIVDGEIEDLYLVKEGLAVNDKIVLDGVYRVQDGDKLKITDQQPQPKSKSPAPVLEV